MSGNSLQHKDQDLFLLLLLGGLGVGAVMLLNGSKEDTGSTGTSGSWFWPAGGAATATPAAADQSTPYVINYPNLLGGSNGGSSYVADVGYPSAAATQQQDITVTQAKKDALISLQTGNVAGWNSYVSTLEGYENLGTDSTGRIRMSSEPWIEAYTVIAEKNGIQGKQGSEAITFYTLMAENGPNNAEQSAAASWLNQYANDPGYSSKKSATVSGSSEKGSSTTATTAGGNTYDKNTGTTTTRTGETSKGWVSH